MEKPFIYNTLNLSSTVIYVKDENYSCAALKDGVFCIIIIDIAELSAMLFCEVQL